MPENRLSHDSELTQNIKQLKALHPVSQLFTYTHLICLYLIVLTKYISVQTDLVITSHDTINTCQFKKKCCNYYMPVWAQLFNALLA